MNGAGLICFSLEITKFNALPAAYTNPLKLTLT